MNREDMATAVVGCGRMVAARRTRRRRRRGDGVKVALKGEVDGHNLAAITTRVIGIGGGCGIARVRHGGLVAVVRFVEWRSLRGGM